MLNTYKYGFHKREDYVFKSKKGLTASVVANISWHKNEPAWMREFRLKSLGIFEKKSMPEWGADLSTIHFDDIFYYIKPVADRAASWGDLPPDIKDTYDKIGIPEAEKKFLAGVSAQYECLTGDTLVFGESGAIRLKDIIRGMIVYALNEQTRTFVKQKVVGVSCKGKRPIFLMRVAGRTIRCTVNHPFLKLQYNKKSGGKRGNFSTTWEYFKNLHVGDYIAIAKTMPNEGTPYTLPHVSLEKNYIGRNKYSSYAVSADWLYNRRQKTLCMPKRSTESLLWLIGLYLGDGYITHVKKHSVTEVLSIAIPATEATMREKVKAALREVFGYELSDEKDVYRIRIPALPIIQLLKKIELAGTAKTKTLPQWVYSLPKSQKLACIGGYIDSDGYLRNGKRNSDVWITSVNKELLTSITMLAISCGLHVSGIHTFSYTPNVTNPLRKSTGYRLQISGDLSPLAQHSLKVSQGFIPRRYYHTYGSYHKSPITTHISDYIGFAAIQEIIAAGEEEVYDIEVNGYHNFVANGIVVHNSEVVYKSVQKMLTDKGVIFLDMDSGLREYPQLVRQYFGTLVPPTDNKFAALNSSVWSGGSFVYVPRGVHVELPLQAYFRINAANMGQFERTLIIAEEGSFVHYVEGCTAPIYTTDSLHSAVVEIFVKKGARVRYTTVQNWSKNVYNLVTKRTRVEEEGVMEWVDGNLGSKITMKYPSVILAGRKAHGEVLSIAYAGSGQHQDAGGKIFHLAPETTSQIISKSISGNGGRTSYRGLIQVVSGAKNIHSNVVCDALILDEDSRSDTYPDMKIHESEVQIEHEATVSKIGDEQLFYLESRGIAKEAARSMIVNGFIEPIVKELPLEYAVEMNRLIALQMEGSVG